MLTYDLVHMSGVLNMVHMFDAMLDMLQMFYDISHMSDVLNKVHMFDIIIYNIYNIYNI
jgi:hypothetical protein